MARRRTRTTLADAVWGLGLAAVGLLLVVNLVRPVVPVADALPGLVVVGALVALAGAFIGRTQAGFWSELVAGASLLVLGILMVRFDLDVRAFALLAALSFGTVGLCRLGSAREFPSLRTPFLLSGMLSVFMAVLLIADVIETSLVQVGLLVGVQMVLDGVTAAAVSGADHPSRRSD